LTTSLSGRLTTMNRDSLPSFRAFDYRVRLNKSAERRMLNEAFRRLAFLHPVENYRYIGFGSTTFSDFILFHKTLNIKDMISIEKREDYKERFEFNKPYSCIKMKYGDSNDILPELAWDKPTIVWLDYDGPLTEAVISDVAFISTKAISGSVVIVTVNANQYRQPRDKNYEEVEKALLEKFKKQIGYETLPPDIKATDLQGDVKMAKTCQRIILDTINKNLRDRNGLLKSEENMLFRSLFNMIYSDNAQMLTVGGIVYSASHADIIKQCEFEKLEFVSKDDQELYDIKVPVITPRERHYLNQRLPHGTKEDAMKIGLTKDEISDFARLYRYAPTYAEVELS
jgi:hypothetical protein